MATWVHFTAAPYAVGGSYRLADDEAQRWVGMGVAIEIADPFSPDEAPTKPAAPMFKLQIDDSLVVVQPGREAIENT